MRGFDDKEERQMVPVVINNCNVNVVYNSNCDSSEEDVKNDQDNFLMKTSTIKFEFLPKPLSTQKWFEL